ncbi:MAG: hypothetical protein ACO1SX_14820, partial [Actinomycetota bacterium]
MADELEGVQQELEQTLVLRRRALHLQSLLASLQAEAAKREPALRELRQRLDRERADVERLERLSFTALLWTVLGRKEARQEKERAELAAASLKQQAGMAESEASEAERKAIEDELTSLGGLEARYAGLMAEKSNLDWVLPDVGGIRWQQAIGVFSASKQKKDATAFVQ